MQTRIPDPVDRVLVHKSDPRNVLLGDLRLAVPSSLDERILAQVEQRDGVAAAVLRGFYVKAPTVDARIPTDNGRYRLASLEPIARFRPAELERILNANAAHDAPELLALYGRDGDHLVLRPDVDECSYERLLLATGLSASLLSLSDKLRISRALERLDDPPRSYCARLLVDTSHQFFFEHPIDHVPGLLIIEAVRQMTVATEFQFRRAPHHAQFILNSMTSDFKGYVDLCLPVDLYMRECEEDTARSDRRSARFETVVCQMHRAAAVFHVVGQCVNSALFERLRRRSSTAVNGRLFVPRANVTTAAVVSRGSSVLASGTLTALWQEGFRLKSSRVSDDADDGAGGCDFSLLFSNVGEIRGRGYVVECLPGGDESPDIGMQVAITYVAPGDRRRYEKAIAMHCTLTDEEPPASPMPEAAGATPHSAHGAPRGDAADGGED